MVGKMGQALNPRENTEIRQKAPLSSSGRVEVEENKEWGQDKKKLRT